MVFLMVPTPIAMVFCGFTEDAASDVVRWHIVAMFAPSFFTGFLIQRYGAEWISAVGLAIMIFAALIAALGISASHFYVALIVLGVGWNFGFIGATAILDAKISASEKASIQGLNDTAIALVASVLSLSSGMVLSGVGWTGLAMVSGGMILVGALVLTFGRSHLRSEALR